MAAMIPSAVLRGGCNENGTGGTNDDRNRLRGAGGFLLVFHGNRKPYHGLAFAFGRLRPGVTAANTYAVADGRASSTTAPVGLGRFRQARTQAARVCRGRNGRGARHPAGCRAHTRSAAA